jgi:GH25 family lysozyme M1 (1,4-beta-N-acetylmuramidase)
MKTPIKRKLYQLSISLILRQTGMIAATLGLAFAPGSVLAQRPTGIDVSSYQGAPNWSSIKGAGISFAWAKATEGTYYIDADFTYNANNGKSAGVVMGAYHFARPDLTSPGSEASYFWNQAGSYIKADGKSLMPMLDMETWNGVVGASSYSDWANQWCNAIVSDANGAGVKIKPFIYVSACNACYFNSSVSGWNSDIANYNGQNPQTGGPWNVCGSCAVWGSGVWTAWQFTSSGSVSGVSGNVDMDVLGGSLAAVTATSTADPHINPCVARNSDGHMEIFAVNKSGVLQHNYFGTGGWSGWISLSGYTFAANTVPAVQMNADGRLEVFIIGTDGHLDHVYQQTASDSTSWSGWSQINNAYTFTQTACVAANTNQDGRIEVFIVGTGGGLCHIYENSPGSSTSWSGWSQLGGSWDQNVCISAGNDLDGRQEVFLIGNTGNLYHIYQTAINAGWSGWASLGGTWSQTARTALTRNADGRLEIFIIGTTGSLYHAYQTVANGGWYTAWPSIGGWSFSQSAKPVAALNSNGSLDVLVIGLDGHMDRANSSNWGSWSSLPSTPVFTQDIRPCLGVNSDGRLEVFTTAPSSDMVHAYQSTPSGSWSGWASLGGSWD